MAGREIKNNAIYFTHDADMRNDPRIKALRRQFGHEGYAVWNYLLEALTNASGFEIPWLDLDIELRAGDFDVAPDKLREIVSYCDRILLLSVVDGVLFSQKHKDRFEKMVSKRTQDRERLAEKRASNRPTGIETPDELTPISTSCSNDKQPNAELSPRQPATITQSRVEYSRVEESRVDERREEKEDISKTSLSLSASDGDAAAERETYFQVLECFYFRGLPDPWREVERFLDHYTAVGWVNKNGAKIKNKLAVARNWEPQNKPARPPVSKDFLYWFRPIYDRMKITNPNESSALLNVFGISRNDSEKKLYFNVNEVSDPVLELEFWRKLGPAIFKAMKEDDPLKSYYGGVNITKR